MILGAYYNSEKNQIKFDSYSDKTPLEAFREQALEILDYSYLGINNVVYSADEKEAFYYFDTNNLDEILNDMSKDYDPFLLNVFEIAKAQNGNYNFICSFPHKPIEITLNREWLHNEEGEEIGEVLFVVPESFVYENYKSCPTNNDCEDLDSFFEIYEPETDGLFLYNLAKEQGVIVEDLGKCYFSPENNPEMNESEEEKEEY